VHEFPIPIRNARPHVAWRCALLRAVALAAVLTVGCGGGELELGTVEGTVTLNGRPVKAEVHFEPVSSEDRSGGRTSSATTDPDGSFRLKYSREREGAILGRHSVLIKILAENPKSYEETIEPTRTVRIVRRVDGGKNVFHFMIRK
jgi:hypothetical protein